ncbi:MAG TPA: hypothetical protein VFA83_18255 [Acidimicrobiales bacterium]|nr:hypothetical protein [Acidimicrobiales bacterium]
MRRALAALAGVTVLVAACGQPSPSQRALSSTSSHLHDVHSGRLDMTMLASTATAASSVGEGFELAGLFAVATKKGRLPVADLRYTRITGAAHAQTRFISTGSAAFLGLDSGVYRLADSRVAGLRARGTAGKDAGLAGLNLDKWISHPVLHPAGTRDGVPVVRITGTLDPIQALNDMLSVASGLGAADEGSPTHLSGAAADRVRGAVRSSSVELVTGRADHLLRELHVEIRLAVSDADNLRSALGRLAGVRLTMGLVVTRPNQAVQVPAPAAARPASELPSPG